MREPTLNRLIDALDSLVDGNENGELGADIEVAAMRLRCIERRMGSAAEASPYLQFLRRIVDAGARPHLAASA